MKNRILTLALAVVLGLMLLPGCQQQTAETPALEKITVSEVARSVFYAPQYAAITQGFFAEEGLDIELITGVTFKSAVFGGQAAFRYMKKQGGGAIVNISSLAARCPTAGRACPRPRF